MKKKLLKAAITTALTVAFAVPAFANPFSDVPVNSWAYDAVNKLAQAGIVDGYNDGTFRGDKTMTRYEMAQIVAKAMNKSLNADQKATVDKLSKEFATELNTLGVKVEGLQNQVDNMVKFSGDARVRYINGDDGNVADKVDYRVRLGATAKINDDMSLYARFNSGNTNPSASTSVATSPVVENAYVNFKALGFDGKIGRQDYDLGQGLLAGAGTNAVLNGVSLREGNFLAFGGKEIVDSSSTMKNSYGAQYKMNVIGAPLTFDYLSQGGTEYAAASTSFNLVPGVKMDAEYAKNIDAKADAYQVKATLGTSGLSVAYKDVKAGALPYDSAANLKVGVNDFYAISAGGQEAKGMEYEYNKALNKNTNLNVLYQDIKDHGSNVRATASVKF